MYLVLEAEYRTVDLFYLDIYLFHVREAVALRQAVRETLYLQQRLEVISLRLSEQICAFHRVGHLVFRE